MTFIFSVIISAFICLAAKELYYFFFRVFFPAAYRLDEMRDFLVAIDDYLAGDSLKYDTVVLDDPSFFHSEDLEEIREHCVEIHNTLEEADILTRYADRFRKELEQTHPSAASRKN